jgi:hypothetical protein
MVLDLFLLGNHSDLVLTVELPKLPEFSVVGAALLDDEGEEPVDVDQAREGILINEIRTAVADPPEVEQLHVGIRRVLGVVDHADRRRDELVPAEGLEAQNQVLQPFSNNLDCLQLDLRPVEKEQPQILQNLGWLDHIGQVVFAEKDLLELVGGEMHLAAVELHEEVEDGLSYFVLLALDVPAADLNIEYIGHLRAVGEILQDDEFITTVSGLIAPSEMVQPKQGTLFMVFVL